MSTELTGVPRTSHESTTVRKARPDELDRLAAILAHAFYDDPVMSWAIADGSRRRELLERSFALYLRRLWFRQDECYITANVVGVIVWELPGRWKAGPSTSSERFPRWRESSAGKCHESWARSLRWSRTIPPSRTITCRSSESSRSGRVVGWAPR